PLALQGRRQVVEEVAHQAERVLPGVALVDDELGEEGDGDRSVGGGGRHRPPHRGDVAELALFGEIAVDLDVGVLARLEPAIDLQDQLLAEGDRRVRLFDGEYSHRLGYRAGAGEVAPTSQLDGRPLETASGPGQLEQGPHRLVIGDGICQD